MKFQFNKADNRTDFEPLKVTWRKSLTAPQDGMWETLTDNARHWRIEVGRKTIGYACVNDDGCLLQFYLLPEWISEGTIAFRQFLQQENVEKALIGTNNPICLSLGLQLQKELKVHTLLFTDYINTTPTNEIGQFINAEQKHIDQIIEFFHKSMGAPKEWLSMYAGGLIERKELFTLIEQDEIIGTCEVRKSITNPDVADIGMVVSPDHRKKGIGSYLLGKAKAIATDWGRLPICSCDIENIGSLKSIRKNGFRSIHQMVLMKF